VRFVDYVVKVRWQAGGSQDTATPGQPGAPARSAPPIHPWVLYNYEAVLRAQIRSLQAAGVRVVVFRPPSSARRAPEQRAFAELSARVAREERAAVCDLLATFDARGPAAEALFIETGVHVTAAGAELLAAEVERTLRTLARPGAPPP
jgi:lysophospholipase L1-like esterase